MINRIKINGLMHLKLLQKIGSAVKKKNVWGSMTILA
jgi:hypothetical protein